MNSDPVKGLPFLSYHGVLKASTEGHKESADHVLGYLDWLLILPLCELQTP